ncbi:MAG TPA: hypothetical protein VF177_10445 [Anaerolineae bacterium]
MLGVLIGSGGIGALVGAMLVNRVTRRFGIGRTLIGSLLFMAVANVLVPLAAGFDKLTLSKVGTILASLWLVFSPVRSLR